MNTKCLLFDLDGTLYSSDSDYIKRIRKNIYTFMCNKGIAEDIEKAEAIWRPLFQKYNQSYKGLRSAGFELNKDEYWSFHRDGMEDYFSKDEKLLALLKQLPNRKIIFTNCREKEAIKLLQLLGIYECFDGVYGADFLNDTCKPEIESFQSLFSAIGETPENTIFFEDSIKNLKTASSLGMGTVLIKGFTATEEGGLDKLDFIDAIVPTLTDGGEKLFEAIPSLLP